MHLYDEVAFGRNLTILRKNCGLTWQAVAKRLEDSIGLHQRHYVAIEMGKAGKEIDDQIIDELMDTVRGFSPGRMHGVNPPGKTVKNTNDMEM